MKLYRQDSKVLYAVTYRTAFYLSGLVIGAYFNQDIIDKLDRNGLAAYFTSLMILAVFFAILAAIHKTVSFYEMRNGKITLDK